MGAIKVHEFTTIDGVVDAPTWTFDYGFPPDLAASVSALMASSAGILLGRRTFEVLAPTWSTRADADVIGGVFFNETRKYVVSSTLSSPDRAWANSTSIGRYSTARLRALKHEVPGDLYVSGSATLVRAMLSDGLVDELHLFVYPLAVGTGARLFPEGGARRLLSLLAVTALSNGVTHLVYGRESADPPQEPAARGEAGAGQLPTVHRAQMTRTTDSQPATR